MFRSRHAKAANGVRAFSCYNVLPRAKYLSRLLQTHQPDTLPPRPSKHQQFTDECIVTAEGSEPTKADQEPMKRLSSGLHSVLALWAAAQLVGASLQDTANSSAFCTVQPESKAVRYSRASLLIHFKSAC